MNTIDGITILSESTYWTSDSNLLSIFIIITSIFTILSILMVINRRLFHSILFVIISIISVICIIESWQKTKYEVTEYKIIISDNVKFNEFNDRYIIVEQEGKIYKIRERDE